MTSNESNNIPSWKRPWSFEEIINASQSWSLAADSGVCELLKSFSTDLLNEVTQLNNNVSELSIESRQTNVIIQNAFNDFCMLANDQFMENLVEDVGSSSIVIDNSKESVEVVQSKEDKIAQVIPQVSETLKIGMQVLENQFEILDMQKTPFATQNNEDSDSETQAVSSTTEYTSQEPIYHPKDPYEHRHLPHLIGTAAFVEDDTLGIGYLDDLEDVPDVSVESEHSHNSDRHDYLTSSSDDEFLSDADQVKSSVRKTSSLESDNIFERKSLGESDDDLFEQKAVASSIVKKSTEESSTRPLSIAEQLQEQLKKKLGIIPPDQSPSLSDKLENIPPNKVISNNSDSDSSPSLQEDRKKVSNNAVPFKQSTNSKMIFQVNSDNEDEDDDDLFADIKPIKKDKIDISVTKTSMKSPVVPDEPRPKEVVQTANKVPSKPIVHVQSESDDDLFSSNPSKPPASITKPVVKRKSPVKFLDSDSDDDLFKPKPQPKTVDKSEIKTRSATVPPKIEPDSKKEKLAAVDKKPQTKSIYSLLNDDDDDDDDLFKVKPKEPSVVSEPINKSSSQVNKIPTKDNTNAELHLDINENKSPKRVETENSTESEANSLFAKSSSSTKDSKSTGEQTDSREKKINKLLPDSDDDDDIFGNIESRMTPGASDPLRQSSAINKVEPVPSARRSMKKKPMDKLIESESSSLFDDNSKPEILEKNDKKLKENEVADKLNETNKSYSTSDSLKTRPSATNHSEKIVTKPETEKNFTQVVVDDSDEDLFGGNLSKLGPAVRIEKPETNSQKNNAGSILLPNTSQNSRSSESEIVIDNVNPLEPERPSFRRLHVGIQNNPLNISVMNEMAKRLQKNNVSESLSDKTDANEKEIEPPEKHSIIDQREILQNNVSTMPSFFIPTSNRSEPVEEAEIDLGKPAEKVQNLTLLTKSRARNIPRKRPVAKKVEVDEVPVLSPPPDKKTPLMSTENPSYLIGMVYDKERYNSKKFKENHCPVPIYQSIYKFIKYKHYLPCPVRSKTTATQFITNRVSTSKEQLSSFNDAIRNMPGNVRMNQSKLEDISPGRQMQFMINYKNLKSIGTTNGRVVPKPELNSHNKKCCVRRKIVDFPNHRKPPNPNFDHHESIRNSSVETSTIPERGTLSVIDKLSFMQDNNRNSNKIVNSDIMDLEQKELNKMALFCRKLLLKRLNQKQFRRSLRKRYKKGVFSFRNTKTNRLIARQRLFAHPKPRGRKDQFRSIHKNDRDCLISTSKQQIMSNCNRQTVNQLSETVLNRSLKKIFASSVNHSVSVALKLNNCDDPGVILIEPIMCITLIICGSLIDLTILHLTQGLSRQIMNHSSSPVGTIRISNYGSNFCVGILSSSLTNFHTNLQKNSNDDINFAISNEIYSLETYKSITDRAINIPVYYEEDNVVFCSGFVDVLVEFPYYGMDSPSSSCVRYPAVECHEACIIIGLKINEPRLYSSSSHRTGSHVERLSNDHTNEIVGKRVKILTKKSADHKNINNINVLDSKYQTDNDFKSAKAKPSSKRRHFKSKRSMRIKPNKVVVNNVTERFCPTLKNKKSSNSHCFSTNVPNQCELEKSAYPIPHSTISKGDCCSSRILPSENKTPLAFSHRLLGGILYKLPFPQMASTVKSSNSFSNTSELFLHAWSHQRVPDAIATKSTVSVEYPIIMQKYSSTDLYNFRDYILNPCEGDKVGVNHFDSTLDELCDKIASIISSQLECVDVELDIESLIMNQQTGNSKNLDDDNLKGYKNIPNPLNSIVADENLNKFLDLEDDFQYSVETCPVIVEDVHELAHDLLCDETVDRVFFRSFKRLISLFGNMNTRINRDSNSSSDDTSNMNNIPPHPNVSSDRVSKHCLPLSDKIRGNISSTLDQDIDQIVEALWLRTSEVLLVLLSVSDSFFSEKNSWTNSDVIKKRPDTNVPDYHRANSTAHSSAFQSLKTVLKNIFSSTPHIFPVKDSNTHCHPNEADHPSSGMFADLFFEFLRLDSDEFDTGSTCYRRQ